MPCSFKAVQTCSADNTHLVVAKTAIGRLTHTRCWPFLLFCVGEQAYRQWGMGDQTMGGRDVRRGTETTQEEQRKYDLEIDDRRGTQTTGEGHRRHERDTDGRRGTQMAGEGQSWQES